MTIENEELIMLRCIQLAMRAIGYTKTNPLVGCIILKDGNIISEGWHALYGEAHAEALALQNVPAEYRDNLKDATLYVTLEPCNHFGKTPPCSHAIVNSGIKKVVVGCMDPNPIVAGRGIQYLRDAGIQVKTGILQSQCELLIRPFKTQIQNKRPYITLKWAQSLDGFIGKSNESIWLSNPWSKRRVHKMRSESDAILVGSGTIQSDNPLLTTRYGFGKSPEIIVLDSIDGLSFTHQIFFEGSKIHLVSPHHRDKQNGELLEFVHTTESPRKHMKSWLEILRDKGIGSIFVEAGSAILQNLIHHNLWDEAYIINCPIKLGNGIPAPILQNIPCIAVENCQNDRWEKYLNV